MLQATLLPLKGRVLGLHGQSGLRARPSALASSSGRKTSITHRYLHQSKLLKAAKQGTRPKLVANSNISLLLFIQLLTSSLLLEAEGSVSSKYGNTLNLPKTDFPMRADAVKREPGLARPEVYTWQQVRPLDPDKCFNDP